MITRFNLDQKRMNYYDNIDQFNKDFKNYKVSDNKIDLLYEIDKPTVIINKERLLS